MSRVTCPKCGDVLGVDEQWKLIDKTLIGTTAGDIQGDYAHMECLP